MPPRNRGLKSNQEDLLLAILEELQDINNNLRELKNLMTSFVTQIQQEEFTREGHIAPLVSNHPHLAPVTTKKSSRRSITSMDILRMRPGTLKTFKAVQKLGEATCTQVAEITGRTHGLESRYLNELARHGLLTKKRVSDGKRHYVVYSVVEDLANPIE